MLAAVFAANQGAVPEAVQQEEAVAAEEDVAAARGDWTQVLELKPSDFVLLVLLLLALFYVVVGFIYRSTLHPSKDDRLAAQRRAKRD